MGKIKKVLERDVVTDVNNVKVLGATELYI